MRKVVSGLFISLDGVTESPGKWQFDHFDDDMAAAMASHIAAEDTVLLGRVTYQEWAPYWPTSTDEPYASHINNTSKYVVSTTLDKVEWGKWDNPKLIKANLAQEIAKLKQQPGKNIGVGGSPTLVRSLLENGLLDELTLMVHPVVVGNGKRLFKDGSGLKRMKLVDSKTTRTGVVIVTYQPARPAAQVLHEPPFIIDDSRPLITVLSRISLKLVSTKAHPSGSLTLCYQPKQI